MSVMCDSNKCEIKEKKFYEQENWGGFNTKISPVVLYENYDL